MADPATPVDLPQRDVQALIEALRIRALALTGEVWERNATRDMMKEAAQQLEDGLAEVDRLRAENDELRHLQGHHASEMKAAEDLWRKQKSEIATLRAARTWQPIRELITEWREDAERELFTRGERAMARHHAELLEAALPPASEVPK